MTSKPANNALTTHPAAQGQQTAVCAGCRAHFVQTRKWQRFCSRPCRNRFNHANSGLKARIEALERRMADVEAMVWPTGK